MKSQIVLLEHDGKFGAFMVWTGPTDTDSDGYWIPSVPFGTRLPQGYYHPSHFDAWLKDREPLLADHGLMVVSFAKDIQNVQAGQKLTPEEVEHIKRRRRYWPEEIFGSSDNWEYFWGVTPDGEPFKVYAPMPKIEEKFPEDIQRAVKGREDAYISPDGLVVRLPGSDGGTITVVFRRADDGHYEAFCPAADLTIKTWKNRDEMFDYIRKVLKHSPARWPDAVKVYYLAGDVGEVDTSWYPSPEVAMKLIFEGTKLEWKKVDGGYYLEVDGDEVFVEVEPGSRIVKELFGCNGVWV